MCTYDTERITVTGSAKGADGWFRATDATISYDHPYTSAPDTRCWWT